MAKAKGSQQGDRVSLKELATRLNTSVCTISKALHNKPKVSDRMRVKVLALAKELGYAPNILARSMARRPLKVALVHSTEWLSYIRPLFKGAMRRAEELRDFHISIKEYAFEGSGNNAGCCEALDKAIADRFDTIIFSSTSSESEMDISRQASEVPIVLLGGGRVPQGNLLCIVRQHSRKCGEVAANMTRLLLPDGGSAAVIIGLANMSDHNEKIRGFGEYLSQCNIAFRGYAESLDEEDHAYFAAAELFGKHPDISLVYVGTENISGVLAFLSEHGLSEKVKVIATGTSDPVNEGLFNGRILCAIDEKPIQQGEMAMDVIFQKMLLGQTPLSTILIPPGIRLKSHLNIQGDAIVAEEDVRPLPWC